VSVTNLLFFAAMELVLCLTPGPAVLTVVSQAVQKGFRRSMGGAAGILTGNTIYFALSAAGLGALLVASRTVFEVIKYCGAGYLVLLGVKMVFVAPPPQTDGAPRETGRPFLEGLVVQLANPKAIVFFTALLPQFIDPHGPVTLQFAVLGLVSILIELPVLAMYALVADRGRVVYARHSRVIERIAGGCLVAAGAKLAATRT
jgi:threonine/homoserine/homoserine lactone efflux protein